MEAPQNGEGTQISVRKRSWKRDSTFSKSWQGSDSEVSNALLKSFSSIEITSNSDSNIKKKFLTADDVSTTSITRSKSGTQHPIIASETIDPSKPTSRRKYIPDDLNRARERTNKHLRPFLEILLAHISAAQNKETEANGAPQNKSLKSRLSIEAKTDLNLPVLNELKRLALDFLLSSSEDLIKGGCVRIMKEVQNLETRLGTKLNSDSIEKQLLVKLLFTLSSYSRVLDYLSTIKDYASERLHHHRTKRKSQPSGLSSAIRPASAPSGEIPMNSELMTPTPTRGFGNEGPIFPEQQTVPSVVIEQKVSEPKPTPISTRTDYESSDSGSSSPVLQTFSTEYKKSATVVPALPLRKMIHQREVMDDSFNMDVDSRPVTRSGRSHSSPKVIEQKEIDQLKTGKLKSILKAPQLKTLSLKALDLHIAKDRPLPPVDKTVICRICEEEIPAALLREHTKFCVIANTWDMIAISSDSQLHRVTKQINEKLEEAIRDQNNPNSPRDRAKVDVELLKTLKKIAQSASSTADLVDCIKWLAKLKDEKKTDTIEEISKQVELLLKDKITALRNAEFAVSNSPRLYRTDSPRALRSPRPHAEAKSSPETSRGMPMIDDFKIVKTITEGAFGRVYLARKKRTNDLYAVKVLKKETMIQKNQVKHIQAERNILARTNNDFVIKMYYAFQSKEYLYLVLEYAPGGDTFSLLGNVGALDKNVAKVYIAETVLALEYIHNQGIVHRDLKPDNLLIDRAGHIKLTDFGLSSIGLAESKSIDKDFEIKRLKQSFDMNKLALLSDDSDIQKNTESLRRRKLLSGVGTPDYLAPEILLGLGHSYPVDWWALGVILFEFLVGITPFSGENVETVFENINNLRISWPEDIEPDAKDLISKLLVIKPEKRMGAAEVKTHSFFDGINWETLRTSEPPFVPKLSNPESTAYFKHRDERFPINNDEAVKEIEESDVYEVGFEDELDFGGFWYINFANLHQKNMELLDDISKTDAPVRKKRSKSF